MTEVLRRRKKERKKERLSKRRQKDSSYIHFVKCVLNREERDHFVEILLIVFHLTILYNVFLYFKAEAVAWAPGLVYGILCAIVALLALWVPETNQYELPQTVEECEVWYKDNRFQLSCFRQRRGEQRESR